MKVAMSVTSLNVSCDGNFLRTDGFPNTFPSGRGMENIPQGIFKGGACESKRFLRAKLSYIVMAITS